jgi:hypothetical protein
MLTSFVQLERRAHKLRKSVLSEHLPLPRLLAARLAAPTTLRGGGFENIDYNHFGEGRQSTGCGLLLALPGKSLKGHEHQFAPPRPSDRCGFAQEAFAGVRGNERDAPKAVVGRPVSLSVRSIQSRRSPPARFSAPVTREPMLTTARGDLASVWVRRGARPVTNCACIRARRFALR